MKTMPFDVWRQVSPTPQAGRIEKIKVMAPEGAGYFILTMEDGNEYDSWVETLEDVEDYLVDLEIQWETPPRA